MSYKSMPINQSGTNVFVGTITNGDDLHESLLAVAAANGVQAGILFLLGGLHEVTFTAYDFERQERQRPLTFTRPLEIVGGHGTISQLDGRLHLHLHLITSFRDENVPHGIQVVGGHVAHASVFAVEFVMHGYDGTAVHRQLDPTTGLKLWSIS
ncbi:MAG: DUF296 domain-containing protein [Chloroflexi bacterium]|nr:DUF296 domain-containing protein [Chloroflexota bacterium]